MKLKIVQIGDPILRQRARPLSVDEIRSPYIQQLIELMRETMHDAPGVGLAAHQVGLPLRLAVIDDKADYHKDLSTQVLAEHRRRPVIDSTSRPYFSHAVPQRILRVKSHATSLNFPDDAFLVNHKGGSPGKLDDRYQNSIIARDVLFFITEDGEHDAEFLSEGFIGGLAVYTDSDRLRSRPLEPGNISLICLEFLRSPGRERLDVEGQHYTFLASKVAQAHRVAVLIGQGEIRRAVTRPQRTSLRPKHPSQN